MGIVIAWLAGEGIITYRWMKAGAPPTPGTLLMASGFFGLCALLGEYRPARPAATMLAFGVVLAAYLQVVGKAPAAQVTGWPPPLITDPNVLLPTGTASSGSGSSGSSPSTGSSGTAPSSGSSWNFWTGYL
jgi:hypothetical protein